ncbi:MAG: DUF4384 domain-containing protein [Gemmatimonadetes bacterium]|nr:DUF4384 domain-containing protein [Gemmatimonadota bacterium]
MLTPVILSLVLAAPVAPAIVSVTRQAAEPPVRVSLSDEGRYRPNEYARVRVRTQSDGYLLVLRTDVDGWVRVLYPTDPSDDHFARGGREFEIRGRGDRKAFAASRHGGTGVVLAAVSEHPFDFQQFVRNDHWDFRALDSLRSESDPEAALVSIAQAMAGDAHFDYDVASYTVSDGRNDYYPTYASVYYPPCYGCYRPGWSFSIGIGFGHRPYYGRGFYYDPFYWDPFYYRAYYPGAFSYVYYSPYRYFNSYRYARYRYGRWPRSYFASSHYYRPRFGVSVAFGDRNAIGYRRAYGYRDASVYRGGISSGSRTYRTGAPVVRPASRPEGVASTRQRYGGGEYVGRPQSGERVTEGRRPVSSGERVSRPPDETVRSRRREDSDARSSGRAIERPRSAPEREPSRAGRSEGYRGGERRGGGEARGGGAVRGGGSYSGGRSAGSEGRRGGGGGSYSGGRSPSSGGRGGGGGGRRR